jgi:hypothetical protein
MNKLPYSLKYGFWFGVVAAISSIVAISSDTIYSMFPANELGTQVFTFIFTVLELPLIPFTLFLQGNVKPTLPFIVVAYFLLGCLIGYIKYKRLYESQ